MSKSKTKHILAVVKVLLAVGLLAWVFRDVSPSSFLATLRRARLGLLACALAGFVASLVIIALRLRLLLRTQRIEIRLWEVIRLTFLGQFFNAVVPGVVGGDLVKAYYVMKHTPHKGAAMVTVFVDRLMGLTELVGLAAAMILCLWASGRVSAESLHGPMVATAAALAVVSGLLLFLLSSRFRRLFHLQKIYSRLPIAHHIESAAAAARQFRRHPLDLLKAVGITLGAHATWIAGIAVAGAALGLDVPWYKYFLYVPLIYIIGSVPITPGGAGLVEASYKLFFASALVGDGQILALALTARVLDIIRGLPGLLVVITGTRIPHADQVEAELADEDARLSAPDQVQP